MSIKVIRIVARITATPGNHCGEDPPAFASTADGGTELTNRNHVTEEA
jgi:hypothetical protein